MKKSTLFLAIAAALGTMFATRAHTQDIAFGFRMGSGFPGDVNRTHPASIVPGLMNSSVQAPRLFGDPLIIDTATNSYRGFIATDTGVTTIDGVAVRPYPTQQSVGGMAATIGNGAPATNQPLDVIDGGFVLVKLANGGVVTKKGPVFVWCAASAGNNVQGGFSAVASAGNTAAISNAFFNGPSDANGVVEIKIGSIL